MTAALLITKAITRGEVKAYAVVEKEDGQHSIVHYRLEREEVQIND